MFMPSDLDNLLNNIIIKKGKGNVGAINPKFALTTMTEAATIWAGEGLTLEQIAFGGKSGDTILVFWADRCIPIQSAPAVVNNNME